MGLFRPLQIGATLLAAALSGCASTSLEQPVVAYENARLIIGDGRVLENATLVVAGSRIHSIGSAPAGARRVNLAGKTVMPMVIDTHIHLSPTREGIVRDLRQRAYWGVSAAMSLGTDSYEVLDLRSQVLPDGARFLSAGRGITMPEPGRTVVPHWVQSPDEGRKAVAELAANKVDIVKIWVDTRDGKYKKVTPEIYAAIIDEAHKRNLRVTAHIFDLEDAKGLIRAGLDALAHGVRDRDIDDELVAMLKARPNLVLTPNLPPRGATPVAQQFFGIQARNLARLNAAGVRITLGTDGNTPAGPHEEMADMVAAGMTPMQVIVAATKNGAEFLRLADAGTLAPRKSADFIVLDANPLDDIANTRRIAQVILRGNPLDRTFPP